MITRAVTYRHRTHVAGLRHATGRHVVTIARVRCVVTSTKTSRRCDEPTPRKTSRLRSKRHVATSLICLAHYIHVCSVCTEITLYSKVFCRWFDLQQCINKLLHVTQFMTFCDGICLTYLNYAFRIRTMQIFLTEKQGTKATRHRTHYQTRSSTRSRTNRASSRPLIQIRKTQTTKSEIINYY